MKRIGKNSGSCGLQIYVAYLSHRCTGLVSKGIDEEEVEEREEVRKRGSVSLHTRAVSLCTLFAVLFLARLRNTTFLLTQYKVTANSIGKFLRAIIDLNF